MEFNDFKSLTDHYLKNNSSVEREALLRVFQGIDWKVLISSLIDNNEVLSDLVNNAYRHDNGFVKLMLIDNRPDYAVRLHIWPSNIMSDSSIHNHPWDLNGLVVTGKYTWDIYQEVEKPSELNLYECKYSDDYQEHNFTYIRGIYMTNILRFDMAKGCLYSSKKHLYHKITKSNKDLAATIMICGRVESNIAHVITDIEKETEEPIKFCNLTENQIKGYLEAVLEEVKI